MALTKELEELLLSLPEEDRETQRTLLEKYEPLRGGYLRQSDYDRKMNELKTDFESKKTQWQTWYEDNKSRYETMSDEVKKAEEAKAEFEKQISELTEKAAQGGDVDPKVLEAAVDARINGRDFVGKKELTAIITQEAKKLADESIKAQFDAEKKELFEKTLPAWSELVLRATELSQKSRDEFGKPLDRGEFRKFMMENQINDLDKAYEQFTAPLKKEAEIKKAADDAAAAKEKEMRAQFANSNPFPGSTATGGEDLGVMQLRMRAGADKKDSSGIPDIAAGTGGLAAAAAAELVAEGKA